MPFRGRHPRRGRSPKRCCRRQKAECRTSNFTSYVTNFLIRIEIYVTLRTKCAQKTSAKTAFRLHARAQNAIRGKLPCRKKRATFESPLRLLEKITSWQNF